MNFQAIGTFVLLKIEETKKTESGIILPDSKVKEETLESFLEVVSVGEDVKGIKVGDMVLLNPKIKGFDVIILEDEKYLLEYQGSIVLKKNK